jgi:hypothetical protein
VVGSAHQGDLVTRMCGSAWCAVKGCTGVKFIMKMRCGGATRSQPQGVSPLRALCLVPGATPAAGLAEHHRCVAVVCASHDK